jgi:hypothetical protein
LIIDFDPQNDRLCSQKENERESFNATIFVGAPIEETDKEQNYAVYDHLKRLYLKTSNKDTKVFNAKVCRPMHQMSESKACMRRQNGKGCRMIGFAMTRRVADSSTLFCNDQESCRQQHTVLQ